MHSSALWKLVMCRDPSFRSNCCGARAVHTLSPSAPLRLTFHDVQAELSKMSLSMKYLAHAGIMAMVASSAVAQDSVARCRVNGISLAGSSSEEVGVAVAANATAYICDSPDVLSVESNALATATEIATATAFAIASISAECYAAGRASFTINGRSVAQAEAFAIAQSFADATTEAAVCGDCEVAADFIAESFEAIYLNATAVAEIDLIGVANGVPIEVAEEAFVARIVEATATAFAQVLVAARADVEDGCSGSIIGVVGGLNDTCTITVNATDGSIASNAETELIVGVIAEACEADETAVQNVTVTAEAIGVAMARAIAEISASCQIQGQTTACVVSEANINATATAVAVAFAFGFADAVSTCDPPTCELSVEILAEAVGEVLAEATTEAVFAQCAGKGDQFDITVLEDEIVNATITSLSTIIAQASVIGGECMIDLDVSAATIIPPPPAPKPMPPAPKPPAPMPPAPMPPAPMPPAPKPPAPMPPAPKPPAPKPMPPAPKPPAPKPPAPKPPAPKPPAPTPPAPTPPPPTGPKCGGTCARNNRQCDGTTFDAPVACCDDKYMCVRRNSRFSQCRLGGEPGFGTWDGTIVTCTP
eukprot:jgi/Ulvmu1/5460/UM228_0002.1